METLYTHTHKKCFGHQYISVKILWFIYSINEMYEQKAQIPPGALQLGESPCSYLDREACEL